MKLSNRNSFKYYLKRPNGTSPTAIYVRAYVEGIEFKYGIGKSIFPELWDKVLQRPTKNKEIIQKFAQIDPHVKIQLQNIESRLNNIDRHIRSYLTSKELQNMPIDFQELQAQLNSSVRKILDKVTDTKTLMLSEFIPVLIQGMEKGTITISNGKSRGQRYSEGTIKNYKGFFTQYLLFEKSRGKKYRFDDVTIDLHKNLLEFYNKKNYAVNTIVDT